MTNRAMPSDPLKVEESEFGFLRVFALDREEIVTRHGVANLIGAHIDADKVEVIDTKDVEAMGLAGYLVQGYGIAEDDVEDEADALNAIDGHVALIPTSAFDGQEAALSPSPPLRFIGLYAEADSEAPTPNITPPPAPESVESPKPENTEPRFGLRDLRLAVVTIVLLVAAYYAYTSL